ncbi:chitin-binding protein, partial [Pseudoalteromonas sp. S4741]
MHSSYPCGDWLTNGWLGRVQYSQRFVGATGSVSFSDEHGELTQLAFDYEILSSEQGEPLAWRLLVVEHIKMHIPLVC